MTTFFSRFSTHHLAVASGVVIIGLGLGGYQVFVPQPKIISPSGPSLGVTQISNTKPVKIVFNHPLKTSTLHYALHPDLSGTWAVKNNFLTDRSTLTFTPNESAELGTRYTIELSGIRSVLNSQTQKYLLSFQTDTLPKYDTVTPTNNDVDVMPDDPIVVSFDKPVSDGVVVTAVLDPEVPLMPGETADKTVTFRHTDDFQKSTAYTLRVFLATSKLDYRTKKRTVSEDKQQVAFITFTTIAAPGIASSSPSGTGVDPATKIRIEFQQPMDRPSVEAAFSIAPTAAGNFSWENDQVLVFTPAQNLKKGQEYTVTVATSAKSKTGVKPDEAFTMKFTTLGVIGASVSPANGAGGVDPNTAVKFTFNQAVDHASAQSKFSFLPVTQGSLSWSGNTLIFKPNSTLAYAQTYTATIAKGVKSVKGLDSVSDFVSRFTTRSQAVTLAVPAYRQAHMYSCMISAARSAMAYRKIYVSESAIIARVGQDTTPWSGTWGGDDGRWGDPDNAIVGPLDNAAATSPAGKQTTNVYWGYGAHWGPISRAMASFGVGNDVHTGMTIQQLAQSITENNPVIIWWVNGIWPSYEVKWKTPAGRTIRGVNGLHVQVVKGFTGTVDNPTSFTVTDSGYGYPGHTFDIGTFKAKWGWFGNTGIIVK